MASIVYTSLSTLQPVELKYQFFKNEELKSKKVSTNDGYTYFEVTGLRNYQDVAVTQNSCFVLTSAINLSEVFTAPKRYQYGKLPGTILIQPQLDSRYYLYYDPLTNQLTLNTQSTPIYIAPVEGTDEVELFIDNKYIQVEENYPYKAYINLESLSQKEIHRQRFHCVYQNSTITLRTKTKDGDRYLAFNSDNILRAVGVRFNNSVLNNYVFQCIPVSNDELRTNFTPTNNWLTYYFTLDEEEKNTSLLVNKNFNIVTNLLIDFPINKTVNSGIANINVANLKTNLTPFGGPASIDNSPPR
jgi:hypothetical protein